MKFDDFAISNFEDRGNFFKLENTIFSKASPNDM
jgi:hypothetical protein